MKKLTRRYKINLAIEADTWLDMISAIRHISFLFVSDWKDEAPLSSVSGGSTFSYVMECEENPEMTHDEYFRLLHLELEKDE